MPREAFKDILDRLARVGGHLRSIKEMVTQERECPNALIQITAVRPALNQVGRIIMEEHIETCVAETFKEGKEDKAIAELKEALRKFI